MPIGVTVGGDEEVVDLVVGDVTVGCVAAGFVSVVAVVGAVSVFIRVSGVSDVDGVGTVLVANGLAFCRGEDEILE